MARTADADGTGMRRDTAPPKQWQPEEVTRVRERLESWGIEEELIEMLGVDVTPPEPRHLAWRVRVEQKVAMLRN